MISKNPPDRFSHAYMDFAPNRIHKINSIEEKSCLIVDGRLLEVWGAIFSHISSGVSGVVKVKKSPVVKKCPFGICEELY